MSDEGGGHTNGPDASCPDPEEVKCPEVDFSPYDEHGRPKPNVAICPCPRLPDPAEQESSEQPKDLTKSDQPETSTNSEQPKETNGTEQNGTKEQPKEEQKEPELSPEELKQLNKSFSDQFKLFSKFGDTKSDGKHLSLSQSDKWMKQAKVIDKRITTTDTGIHFKKLKSLKVTEADYKKFLDDLSKTKKVSCIEIKKKMISCGPPGVSSQAAGVKTPSAFERLTDTSKYTGSHKQRFDETGKGRGIAGRKDVNESSGYVSGYQNKNTYDKKNPK